MKRADFFWIAIVIAVIALVSIRAYGRALDPIIDTGRDLYIPEQLRSGVKLYRDVLYYYPPLAPYLLAAITAITGSSLGAYTMIGIAIAIATAAAIYAIGRIAASPLAGGAAALLFACCSVYSISGRTSNYFFPYAHAATLAMLFFLAGSAFLLARWTAPALLFLLAASSTKLEYAVFALVIIAIARISIRWIGAYVAAAILSFIVVDRYFDEGWLFDNVLASSLLRGTSARYFYRQVAGFDAIGSNLMAALISVAVFVAIVLALRATTRWQSRALSIVVAIAIGVLAFVTADQFFRGWAIVQLVLLPFAIRKPGEPMLMLLALSLCASSRVFLRMTPAWYGFVFLVPLYVLVAYVFFEWLPLRGVYSKSAARLAIVPIVVVAASFLWRANEVIAQKRFPIRSSRGLFYDANLGRAAALDGFISQFSGRSLVVVPEGLTLNYLTRTKTPVRFHTFTPVETAEPEVEAEIIKDFAAHPPEFIAVVTRAVTDFGYRGFGVDYDRRFAAMIRARYVPVKRWRLPSFELILLKNARPDSSLRSE